ncbi:hypothetical protein Tco_1184546 [Tanacetum coccineum]
MLPTGELPSPPLEKLLSELDVAKSENEYLVKKMNEMESYYEGLMQELEENQKRILGDCSRDRDDDESTDGGSDGGSDTQSSWTKQVVECEGPTISRSRNSEIQGVPKKIREENIKVIDDSTELELKRPRATDNDGVIPRKDDDDIHHVHHYHDIDTDEPLSNQNDFGLNDLSADAPHCGKHGSCNVPNGSNTAVNIEGTKVENVGIVEKSGSGGDGSGNNNHKSAQREAALIKF